MHKHQILIFGFLLSLTCSMIGLARFIWTLQGEPVFWFGILVFAITLIPFSVISLLEIRLLIQIRKAEHSRQIITRNQILMIATFFINIFVLAVVLLTVGANPAEDSLRMLVWIPSFSLLAQGISFIISFVVPGQNP